MIANKVKRLNTILNQLMKISQSWAFRKGFDSELARDLRHEAILLNHESYIQNIPAYAKLAQEEKCTETPDIIDIKQKLMLPDSIFKSYRQEWLDEGDYGCMNRWLSGLHQKPVNMDVRNIKSIDDWITNLRRTGVGVSYSSGTSGCFSFVPRSVEDLDRARTANTCYITPLLAYNTTGTPLMRLLMPLAMGMLSPGKFARLTRQAGIRDFDGAFLGFREGAMGNQRLMEEMAPLFRRSYVLNDTRLDATALRCSRRGARNEEEQRLVDVFQADVAGKKGQNYAKMLENINRSTLEGQKVFIFGAPYQFKELCEAATVRNIGHCLKRGSLILFGGGWKSFSGEIMDRQSLVGLLSTTFDTPPDRILEGYSMTEISMLTLRCEAGRFHIPPIIEPVVLDESLSPLEGRDLDGTFGFLDPLAASYPGFLISGDHVRMLDEECACGLVGPALMNIRRAASADVKGCGGVMGSLQA